MARGIAPTDPARTSAHEPESSDLLASASKRDPDATASARPSAADDIASRSIAPGSIGGDHRAFGRYDILGEHGRGGLGRVSRAHDRELDRDVAIKELLHRTSVSEVRFFREALITARLEHPGIVPVHEAGRRSDGTPFYAMKLVAGRPLRDLIAERHTVAERLELLHHVIAVADAIAYAHNKNIIHRDLKPSNVIVGDFGETVVIDWGLAKDLDSAEEHESAQSTTASPTDIGLTNTGAVLGTPDYMPPEQARGDKVDKRADVFAIGAMLWELSALAKVPPQDKHIRHRLLYRARIDADLVAILDKALDPVPENRYVDAGELSNDLKLFKSGGRIAARHYSLLALYSHWLRRHRRLAAFVSVSLALAIAIAYTYIQNIAAEKNKAQHANIVAGIATTTMQVALNEETLSHAALLLDKDPSAASDVLQTYRGNDTLRARALRAQAIGAGIAQRRLTPHADTVYWMHQIQNGEIVSIGADNKIVRTSAMGQYETLGRILDSKNVVAYTDERNLLASVCEQQTICVFVLKESGAHIRTRLQGIDPQSVAFSADGKRLVAISRNDSITEWNIDDLDNPTELWQVKEQGDTILDLKGDTWGIVTAKSVIAIREGSVFARIPLLGILTADVSPSSSMIALGTAEGSLSIASLGTFSVKSSSKACDAPLTAVRWLANSDIVVFGCKDGSIGTYDTTQKTRHVVTNITGTADVIAVSSDGHFVGVGGSAGTIHILDLTSGTSSTYLGHSGRITAIIPPHATSGSWLTADTSGGVRAWASPNQGARVLLSAATRLVDAQFLDLHRIVTSGQGSTLHLIDHGREVALSPHEGGCVFLETSDDKSKLAAFGWGGKIEIWDTGTLRRLYLIDAHHATTTQLKYITPEEIAFAGTDGILSRWSAREGIISIGDFHKPISSFRYLSSRSSFVVELDDGSLWLLDEYKHITEIPHGRDRARLMQVSSDQRWLITASDDGFAVVYETSNWKPVLQINGTGPIRHAIFSPTNEVLAVAFKSGSVRIGNLTKLNGAPNWSNISWMEFPAHPRFLAFDTLGSILTITSSEGLFWFYRVSDGNLTCLPTGYAGLTIVRPSPDDRTAISIQPAGKLIELDLSALTN